MNYFISCDWGTSLFRLRLVDRQRQAVLGEVTGKNGVSVLYEEWQRSGQRQEQRLAFYQAALRQGIERLQGRCALSLADLPLVLSGMASSSLGMLELSYRPVPFDLAGRDLHKVEIRASETFPHSILLVSGARTDRDVMRGEETQLVGCRVPGEVAGRERIYLFPGTHSKHVRVAGDRVVDFSTYMTGEFFRLLSRSSILAASVSAVDPAMAALPPAFGQGVQDSRSANLLHSAFFVRTRQLLANAGKDDNYYYLSGLLIGEELKQLTGGRAPLTLVAAGRMMHYYAAACLQLGVTGMDVIDADRALVLGHCRLLELPAVAEHEK